MCVKVTSAFVLNTVNDVNFLTASDQYSTQHTVIAAHAYNIYNVS
jgi:hypothetical protein